MRAALRIGLVVAGIAWCLTGRPVVLAADEPESPGGGTQPAAEATAKPDSPRPVLSGRIVDETGAPVTDATVQLTATSPTPEGVLQQFEAKTNEDGRYQFDAIETENDFWLRIRSTRWVGKMNFRELPQVHLVPADSLERDFTLARACRVKIGTFDEVGKPVAGVRVYVGSLADDRMGSNESVTTDKFGFATIGGLAPSDIDYLFGTMHADYAFAKAQLKLSDPEKETYKILVLFKGVDVAGTAMCSDGKPATGWTMYAMPDWWKFGIYPRGAKIGSDGKFVLSHVGPDKYNMTVLVPTGGGMSRSESVASGVALPAGGPLDLKLKTLSPASMTEIAGRVRFVGGEITGMISVDAASEDGQHRGSGFIERGSDTFRLGPLPPGKYQMSFSSTEIEEKQLDDVVAPSEGLDVELQVTGKPKLVGRVTGPGGSPLEGLQIRVVKLNSLRGPNYVQESQWKAIAGSEGTFKVDVVGPGVYQVVAVADGMAPTKSAEINTDEIKGEPISLELNPGSSLSGTVINEDGDPIDGAKVIPLSQAMVVVAQRAGHPGGEENSVETVGGAFTLPHVAEGEETLRCEHPDYCFSLVENVTIAAGENMLKPIVLTRGGTVKGRVFDASGKPAAGVALRFQDSSGYNGSAAEDAGCLATAVTNADGEYEVRRLPEKLCYASRTDEWEHPGAVRQAIVPVNGETHVLDFGGPKSVKGQLLVNGTPVADTRVELCGNSPHFGVFKAYAKTDADGRFVFWSPPIGERTLYYTAPNTRNEWVNVGEVRITDESGDLGTIDARTATMTVTTTGISPAVAEGAGVYLHEYDEHRPLGRNVGEAEPRPSVDAPHVITRITPGSYELILSRKDNVAFRQRVEVGADHAELAVTMAWPPGNATLHGRIDDAVRGDRDRSLRCFLWSKDQRIFAIVFPGDGSYSIANLPAGEYYLTDQYVRNAKPLLEFTLADGEDRTLDLTTDNWKPNTTDMGMLSVLCTTSEGVPLPGAEVELTAEGAGGKVQRPDENQEGRATFFTPPGTYQISIAYPGFEPAAGSVTVESVTADDRSTKSFERVFRLTPIAR